LLAPAVALACGWEASAGWAVLHDRNGYFTRGSPDDAYTKLGELARGGSALKAITFTPGGGWAILYDRNGYFTRNIPDEAFRKLGELARKGSALKAITFTPGGGWAILYDRNGYFTRGIPDDAYNKLGDLARDGSELKSITFTPGGGWAILYGRNGYHTRGIPDDAFRKLGDLARDGSELKAIAFTPGGGWAILYDRNGYFTRNIPDEAFRKLGELARKGSTLKGLTWTAEPTIRLSKNDEATRKQVLNLMARYKVPGLSIAVVEGSRIAWARGYGVLEAGRADAVTPKTRFQAASISKPVTALAALRLVQQGKLTLDGPLNDNLASWKVPANALTRKRPVALRHVLSHSSGLTVSGFAGYEVDAPVPTLLQVLDGKGPANNAAIRVDRLPGSAYRYGGGGFCVLQQAMIDSVGASFPTLMRSLVFEPLAMRSSSFEQPPSRASAAVSASGHRAGKPVRGRWHVYPEMAAAGMWTTPSDLARYVLAVNDARAGRSALLRADLARDMLTRQIASSGLGLVVSGSGRSLSYTHNGINLGFECVLIGYPQTGQGAVIMTNGEGGAALAQALIQALRVEYGWPG
jgi:CubicO group peptidase (beta-lactamase class C family)